MKRNYREQLLELADRIAEEAIEETKKKSSETINISELDFTLAMNALREMKGHHYYENLRVGVITSDFCGGRKGHVVLFRDDKDGTYTIESPITPEAIQEQKAKGSAICTVGTMINVPKCYVAEMKGLVP